MPILNDKRLTKKISLPDIEGSEVEIFGNILLKDVDPAAFSGTAEAVGLKALPWIIKSWNLTNEAGEVLPITPDTVGLLEMEQAAFLMDAYLSFKEECKKK